MEKKTLVINEGSLLAKIILVTLPIGNKLDITQRAKEHLRGAKYLFSEDTRVFRAMMERFEVDTSSIRVSSFHDHSDQMKVKKIFEIIESGDDVYFVSDAGSPILSDPGYPLIKEALSRGVEVETIPGVSAVTAALEVSGLPPHPFSFHAFLPRERGKIETFFKKNFLQGGTHICFESPNRILKTLGILSQLNEDVDVCVARELTKPFQSIHRFRSSDFLNVKDEIVCKGEIVLLFYSEGHSSFARDEQLSGLVKDYLEGKRSTKKLAKIFSKITGDDVKEAYAQLST